MKTLPWLIIIVLIVLLFLQRECTPTPKCPECPGITYDTIHDTITNQTTAYIPKPIYRDTGSTKWRYHKVDTLQILSDYFARNLYRDTLQNDTNALIILTDTVSQNRITYRHPQITLYPHFIRQTTHVEVLQPPTRKLFIGLAIGRNPNQFSLAPTLMYQSKKVTAYSLSYDFLNNYAYIGVYWKITIRK